MDSTTYSDIAEGIRAGLAIRACSDESEALKDLSPNDASCAFEYGRIAGHRAGEGGEAAAWEQVRLAQAEFRARQIAQVRHEMEEARATYLAAKRTLRAWGA